MRQTNSVILVSHGQPSEPEIGEAEIRDLAGAVQAHAPDFQVIGATLAAPGALEAALEAAPDPLVYPYFMSDGWFTQTALPKRLDGRAARIAAPFGMDRALPGFTDRWLTAELAARGWHAADTTLFVAGHGSGRSPRPAEVTRAFTKALSLPFAERRCGFVEEPPHLVDTARGLPAQSICLPFFALKRGHVLDDIPEALEETGFSGALLEPFGLHPDLPAFLADQLAQQMAPTS